MDCQGWARTVGGMTVTFAELEAAAPSIAAFARKKIEQTGLSLVGTTRRDGWPRISGWELWICDGRVYVGSMPNAVKVRDLRRDPRCCIFTPLADKDDLEGEAKLFCVAREVEDPAEWDTARQSFLDQRGFDMGGPGGAHLFEMGIQGAAFQRAVGDEFLTTSWVEGDRVRERKRVGALGESVELT
jgi:hypothetical protein